MRASPLFPCKLSPASHLSLHPSAHLSLPPPFCFATQAVGVLLDCGAGSLTMYKNGQRLGVAVANGVAGDLHWAACLRHNGHSVRFAALPAPPA